MTAPALVIAGAASGVGKTTVTLGLLEAWRRRGLTVQAFKVGPDFIDPGLHEAVTGRPSYNLDGWMCSRERVVETVRRRAAGADLVVIEGMMGCFDGVDGSSERGSTAEIAKWLGAPVVLVVDASAQARSVAAVVLGFERFDPALRVVATIANRVGGAAHARWLQEAIAGACGAVPVGMLPQRADLERPERHLGLVTAADRPFAPDYLERLAAAIAGHVDVDSLVSLARALDLPPSGAGERCPAPGTGRRARIGVARDRAFHFYYAENLDALQAAGAELVFWSPLADAAVPDVGGLYIGGGYPELHAPALAGNERGRAAVRRFIGAGRPVYAECGGLMYLAESLEDPDGGVHPMVGVLPARVRMRPRRLVLAYAEVELVADTPIGGAGARARGHLFHCSTLDPVAGSVGRAYRVRLHPGSSAPAEGYLVERALMSYVHLHFASAPALAEAFVAACAR
jgi:cobyrinic acid a,c-diamide synthase